MGLPALRHEPQHHTRKPNLRVVPKSHTRGAARPRTSGQSGRGQHASASFQTYVFVVTAIIVIAIAGMARVWLSVQAAEASVQSSKLRQEIKAARYTGDMLEIQQSALAAPSRVQAIAGQAMGMTVADGVDYLDITDTPVNKAAARRSPAVAGGSKVKGVLASAMDMAAGEAHVMLVGDVGLASAK